jgi:hypothetical protein
MVLSLTIDVSRWISVKVWQKYGTSTIRECGPVVQGMVGRHPRIEEEEAAGTSIDHSMVDWDNDITIIAVDCKGRIRVDTVHQEMMMSAIARTERDLDNNTLQEMTIVVTTRHDLTKQTAMKDIITGMTLHLAANLMAMVGEGELVPGVSHLIIAVATGSGESIPRNDTVMRGLMGMRPNVRDIMMTMDTVQGDTIAATKIVEVVERKVVIATGDIVTAIKINGDMASIIVITVMKAISDGTKENTVMIIDTGNESTRNENDAVTAEVAVTKINR